MNKSTTSKNFTGDANIDLKKKNYGVSGSVLSQTGSGSHTRKQYRHESEI